MFLVGIFLVGNLYTLLNNLHDLTNNVICDVIFNDQKISSYLIQNLNATFTLSDLKTCNYSKYVCYSNL